VLLCITNQHQSDIAQITVSALNSPSYLNIHPCNNCVLLQQLNYT
jgi:hypothetical protein